MNCIAASYTPTNKQTNKQTKKQTNKQTQWWWWGEVVDV